MKIIKDISLEEIKRGSNWKATYPEDPDAPFEDCLVEETIDFKPEDTIAYSVISVTEDEQVKPLIQIKEVVYLDYGGDYCEWIDGKWRQLGLVPNPNAPISQEYVANPLDIDPSFDADHDYRAWHRDNFKKYISKI